MKKLTRIVSSYYGLGDQMGFSLNKDQIYNFMLKHKLAISSDSIWKYNEKLKVWFRIWPK